MIGHVLRHDGLLHEIIDGRMRGTRYTNKRANISDATWFGKWWLCCTQTGSWRQRDMDTQSKDVKNLLHNRRLLMMICKR